MRKAPAPFPDFRGSAGRLSDSSCVPGALRGSRRFFIVGFKFSFNFGFPFSFRLRLRFTQDHRLNIAVFILIEHRRGDRTGLRPRLPSQRLPAN